MFLKENCINENYYWFNEPKYEIANSQLILYTNPDTDFWQKTHYGFERDNGHCLLTKVKNDFCLTVKTQFFPQKQYDQCGLIIRIDSENWIKASTEYETQSHARLGSVVTNLGFSDWATIDIHKKQTSMWYRIQSQHTNDFLIEYSENGKDWNQLRITHLHKKFDEISVGIYACSPMQSSFKSIFDNYILEESRWK